MNPKTRNGSLALAAVAALLLAGCPEDAPISAPWQDTFDRVELGANYLNTGGPYRIEGGKLKVKGAYNHPLWLKKKLPRDAEISFEVTSRTPDGDIKIEAWGDGRSHATTRGAYTATSYVFIFGGWGNSLSTLARMNEHGADRKTRDDMKVESGRTYTFTIRRKGNKVEWLIDGDLFLSFDDSEPLEGKDHAYLGFNNWQSDVAFDNLRIKPL